MADSIRLALMWTLQTQFTGYILARKQQLPELELIPRQPNRGPIDELVENKADFAVTSPMHLLGAAERVKDVVFIAQFMPRSPVRLTGLKRRVGETIPKDRKLKVAVWSGEDSELRAILRANEVELDAVDFVPVADGVPELLAGEVDFAQTTTYNELPQVVAAAGEDEVVAYDPREYQVDVAKDGLAVRRDFLEARPEAAVKLISAASAGWRQALADPAAAATEVCRLIPGLDREFQQQQLARMVDLFDSERSLGEPLPEEIERAKRCALAAGHGELTPAFDLDASYWQAAQSDG